MFKIPAYRQAGKYQNIIIFLVLNLEKFESAPSLPAEEEGS